MRNKRSDHNYYIKHKQEILEKQKVYRSNNPWYVDKQRKYQREKARKPEVKEANRKRQLYRIGWTPELYAEKEKEQERKCALCGEVPVNRGLDADHEHCVPPKPRGLLCNKHNQMLGLSGDNPELLRKAANYIEQYRRLR